MSSVREDIAEMFKIARQEGALRKWADGLSDADEVLSHPRIGVIAEDQKPEVFSVHFNHHSKAYCDGYLAACHRIEKANFKRIEVEDGLET